MPDWKSEVKRRLARLGLEPAREAEIAEELAQHLEDRFLELQSGGATGPDASRAVLAELDEIGRLPRGLRRPDRAAAEPVVLGAERMNVFGEAWQDLRFGMRTMRRQPLVSAIAVLALALGIGGNTAIFSMVNAILLRQLPFREPDRLVSVYVRRPDPGRFSFNMPDFIDFRDQNRSLAGLAAYASWSANLSDGGDPERLQGMRVSADAFEMLGVEAEVGRALQPSDDTPGQQRVVVLGHGLWRRRFGSDPAIVGKSLTLNGAGYVVVGVLPPQVVLPIRNAELAIPLAPEADPWRGVRNSTNFLRGWARLKPGVTREQAESDLTAVAQRIRRQYPVANAQKLGVTLVALPDEVVAGFRLALWVLLGAVGAVLLMTCINLGGLSLARSATRHREMVIRTALGATRRRLVRQLATESLLPAVLGGGVGLLLAWYGIDLLIALSPASLPRAAEVHVDVRVLGFTLALSLLAGAIFGLVPAWQATRVNLNDALKESARGGAGGRRQSRARGVMVVSEVALSLALLVGAGVLINSFLRLQAVDPGFDARDVLVVRLSLPKAQYPNRAAATAFHDALRPALAALPGVASVGVVSSLPLSGDSATIPFTIEGRAAAPGEEMLAGYRLIDAGYLRALRIPLLSGRGFTGDDAAATPNVALVSRSLARRCWPDGSPLGAHLMIDDNDQGPRPVEVVGVVGDVKHTGLDEEPAPHIYLPIHQTHEDSVIWLTSNQYWLLRTEVDPLTLSGAVRRAIQAVDPEVPASSIRTMDDYLAASVAPRRFNLWLLTVFAAAALVLAATGLYGVIACGVSQRRREIGIRMALGAQPGDVLRLVIGEGMAMTLGGVAIGLAAALGLTRLMKSLLFNVSATDPLTFCLTTWLLALVALLACWIPARRAMRVDPTVALRED